MTLQISRSTPNCHGTVQRELIHSIPTTVQGSRVVPGLVTELDAPSGGAQKPVAREFLTL